MAQDTEKIERDFMQNTKAQTGRTLEEWFAIIKPSGLDKPNAILNWLKQEHKLNHNQANLLSGIYLNDGKPVYDRAVLFEKLFADKQDLLPLYRALEKGVKETVPDVLLIPTKAYVSIEAKKIFACASMTKKNIRVGLDLGDEPFGDYVQKAKSLGAMPNLTHMIEIAEVKNVNDKLLGYVRHAYERVHKK